MRWPLTLGLVLAASFAQAADWDVPNRPGAIAETLSRAAEGDMLRLRPGTYFETVVLDKSVTLDGGGAATIDGQGNGSVITVTGDNVTVQGLTVVGSWSEHDGIDSGIQLLKTADAPIVRDNVLLGNLYGIDVHGADDAVVSNNRIEGRQDRHMNARGNGI